MTTLDHPLPTYSPAKRWWAYELGAALIALACAWIALTLLDAHPSAPFTLADSIVLSLPLVGAGLALTVRFVAQLHLQSAPAHETVPAAPDRLAPAVSRAGLYTAVVGALLTIGYALSAPGSWTSGSHPVIGWLLTTACAVWASWCTIRIAVLSATSPRRVVWPQAMAALATFALSMFLFQMMPRWPVLVGAGVSMFLFAACVVLTRSVLPRRGSGGGVAEGGDDTVSRAQRRRQRPTFFNWVHTLVRTERLVVTAAIVMFIVVPTAIVGVVMGAPAAVVSLLLGLAFAAVAVRDVTQQI